MIFKKGTMASIVDNPSKILSDSMLNDLKRKQTITGGDKVSKKPRFDDDEKTDMVTTNGNHTEKCNDVVDNGEQPTPAKVEPTAAPIDLSKINTEMEVDDGKIITPDDIRKLKEMLRQEEAKLQLIKR